LVPVWLFGPWLPLIDLVAFVGMDSYPPQLSYGPFHYSVFQFTYFGHYLISRLLVDLGVPIRFEIPFFYLLQVGICFTVVWRILERIVTETWLCALGVAIGVLAYWDGVFLWGGPLAYSLAAAFITVATFLAFRGCAEPEKDAELPIVLAVLFALLCHPFAVPFALVLCGVRWLFNRRRRWQTLALAAGIGIYAWVIVRDSPTSEATASGGLRQLFGFDLGQMHQRVIGLFLQDAAFVKTLFGNVPVSSWVFFIGLAVIHVCGFLLSPWIAWRTKGVGWLRLIATLNSATAILYLFSFDLPTGPIPEWPQRILTLYAPFTFIAGFAAIIHVFGGLLARCARNFPSRAIQLAPWCVLLFAAWTEARVFHFSRRLEAAIAEARHDLLASGVKGAYVVVSGVDAVHPFYLRCVPFVLFSDPAVIAQHLLIGTEWHFKARHPTRIAEASLESGRQRFLAEFSSAKSHVSVRLIPQPEDRFPTIERTNVFRWGNPVDLANDQRAQGVELFENGAYVDAAKHFNTAVHLLPNDAAPWIDAGVAFYDAGMLEEAGQHFQHALQLAPTSADAHTDYAAVLIDLGKLADAEAHLQRAHQLDPRNPRANQLQQKLEQAQLAARVRNPPVGK
jgi:tetratricopeptide (TPR) repeat protein